MRPSSGWGEVCAGEAEEGRGGGSPDSRWMAFGKPLAQRTGWRIDESEDPDGWGTGQGEGPA